MLPQKKILCFFLSCLLTLTFILTGCFNQNKEKLVILSSSENKTLEPILQEFAQKNNIDIEMKYKGSVDIMLELEKDNPPYDMVWAANSMWVTLGDKHHLVKNSKSIMTSPIVFGIRKSLAEKLGFVGKPVYVKDILAAIQAKKLTFAMTSASQSNSGASAYLGFLSALLGNPETISKQDLYKPELKEKMRSLLSGINRSSGSSEWLKDLFLKSNYDAMVNYEAVIIDTNKELVKQGREPLYAVYPVDGLVMADYCLGYLNQGDKKKEELFPKLQNYLLSQSVQKEILSLGRRTGFGGTAAGASQAVFNPDWGIDVNRVLSPIKLPSAQIILEALNLYQTQFRKPSFTVFCLDYSGSMSGQGEEELKKAMATLLKQDIAKTYLLQASPDDRIVVIPFNNEIVGVWQGEGSNPVSLDRLENKIEQLRPNGGTDIYSPVIEGMAQIKKERLKGYIVSIVLMTDGKSNTGRNFTQLKEAWTALHQDVPVFSITFGDASPDQLQEIANLTNSTVLDGSKDLVAAFKKVRGYSQ